MFILFTMSALKRDDVLHGIGANGIFQFIV